MITLVCQGELFGIKTDFIGSLKSGLATGLAMNSTAEGVNDKHVSGWNDAVKVNKLSLNLPLLSCCFSQAAHIANTPLSPYIDKELLGNNRYTFFVVYNCYYKSTECFS